MRRFFATLMTFLLAGVAVWPAFVLAAPADTAAAESRRLADELLKQAPAQVAEIAPGVVLPLWRSPDGRLLAIVASSSQPQWIPLRARAPLFNSALDFRAVDASTFLYSGLRYELPGGLHAGAALVQHQLQLPGCVAAQPGVRGSLCLQNHAVGGVMGGEVNAGFSRGAAGVNIALGLSRPSGSSLLGGTPTLAPLYGAYMAEPLGGLPLGLLGTSTTVRAQGHMTLGETRLELGAGYGQLQPRSDLPLTFSGLTERSLSFGVDRGAISGVITGRVLQPNALIGIPGGPYQHSSTIDPGITWRLPWQGALSVGTQNLWSFGTPPAIAGQPADASRIPYVQYHQDL